MPKPNIVWLNCDHMLFAHHRKEYEYPLLPTYDDVCSQGVEFTNAVSVSPVCGPARASMLTGVYPHRHGMLQNDGLGGSRLEFNKGEPLFNHYLQQEGYRTGYFGKWHCGEEHIARDFGFEGFSCPGYGHPYWYEEYNTYLKEMNLPDPEVTVEWRWGDPSWKGKKVRLKDFPKPYRSPYYLMESMGTLNTPLETHEAYFIAHLASRWLEGIQQDEPFCLRVDPWGPHLPYWVGGPFLDSVDPNHFKPYPSFGSDLPHRPQHHRDLLDYRRRGGSSPEWKDWQPILARSHEHAALVDAALGRVINTLTELEMMDNTIIIYTADHGGTLASNGELVDKGWLMVEETMRIPMAIQWPQMNPASDTCPHLVSNMDIVPTVLEAAGAKIPSPMDGRSLTSLVENPVDSEWSDDLMVEHHGHYDEIHFQRQLRWKNLKYVAHLDDLDELYDLSTDPFEMANLANEPNMRTTLLEGRKRLKKWMTAHNDNSIHAHRLLQQMDRSHDANPAF